MQAEDKWILSKTQSKISEITEAVEKMRLREALHDILFTFETDLVGTIREFKLKKEMMFQEFFIKSIQSELQCCPHLHHILLKKCGRN